MSNFVSLGVRNCNPLNIRFSSSNSWLGMLETPCQGFCRFESMEYGVRAALFLLRKYVVAYKCSSVPLLINRWAPSFENDTNSYVFFVEKKLSTYNCHELIFIPTEGDDRFPSLNTHRSIFEWTLISAMAAIESRCEISWDTYKTACDLLRDASYPRAIHSFAK